MSESALQRRFPAAADIPRIELADLPTPVDHAERLGDAIGVPGLFIKRDDESGTLYGGNKVRKLEYLLGEARAEGHREVWTVGAIGSHHVLATCIYARDNGFEPAALHFPQPITDHVLDNLRALSTTRPKLTLVDHKAKLPAEMFKAKIKEWIKPGVYYIPGGGSSPTGATGYVNAALELAESVERGEMPEPDVLFVAAGTCGTLAGLTLGCKMAGLDTRIVGIRVVDKVVANKTLATHLANRTAKHLREFGLSDVPKVSRSDFEMLDDYFGNGYGEPTAAGMHAINRAADEADLGLDPTYTGKTFAGLMGERERLELASKNVLYWHTLSSADLGDRIENADPERDLPDDYHEFFDA